MFTSKLSIGDVRVFVDDIKNPFVKGRTVEVLDIKDGWVKYLLHGVVSYREIGSFLSLYKKVKP